MNTACTVLLIVFVRKTLRRDVVEDGDVLSSISVPAYG